MTDTIISLCPGVLFPILIIFTIFEYTIFKITVAITHIVRKVSDTVIFRTNIDVTPCQPSVRSRQPLFRPFFIFKYIFQTLGIFSQFPLHAQIIRTRGNHHSHTDNGGKQYMFLFHISYYILTVKPKVSILDNGYCCPLELPISGSHNLNLENVNRFVPIKKMRTLFIKIARLMFFGSV